MNERPWVKPVERTPVDDIVVVDTWVDLPPDPRCYLYQVIGYSAVASPDTPCGRSSWSTPDINFQIQVCLDDFGQNVIHELRTTVGYDWVKFLIDATNLTANADDASFTFEDFDPNLDRAHSSLEDWNATDTNWTPLCSFEPRAHVLQAALWLIATLKRGVPEQIDGTPVREKVVDPIVAGKMRYRTYTPHGEVNGGALTLLLRDANCTGPKITQLASDPAGPCSTGSILPCSACGTECPEVKHALDLTGTITFNWVFPDGATSATMANNHGYPESNRHVWLCTTRLDRSAIMFDYYLALAAAHMLQAMTLAPLPLETFDDWLLRWAKNVVAMHSATRMALSAAAELASVVVHETTHNVTLWHCSNESGEPVGGCMQDFAAEVFQRYAWARFGLPRTRHHTGSNTSSETYWDTFYDYSPFLMTPEASGSEITVLRDPTSIECVQGNDEALESGGLGAEGGGAALALVGLLGGGGVALVVGAGVAAIGAWVRQEAHRVDREDTADTEGTSAEIRWQVDTPLQAGGHVVYCCISNRDVGGCTSAENEPSLCWTTDQPDGYLPCCDQS